MRDFSPLKPPRNSPELVNVTLYVRGIDGIRLNLLEKSLLGFSGSNRVPISFKVKKLQFQTFLRQFHILAAFGTWLIFELSATERTASSIQFRNRMSCFQSSSLESLGEFLISSKSPFPLFYFHIVE